MKHILRTLALPTALAATLVLAGCGSADTSAPHGMKTDDMKTSGSAATGTVASTSKNKADVAFATMMIPHHAQAIVMADLALRQATDPKIKALAAKIKTAQSPEIERMSGWLTGWGEKAPTGGSDNMSSMPGMSGMGDQTGGMMSAKEITNLGKAKGTAFDRMWLEMMVTHHQGAVGQAKTALTQGTNPDAKKLAQSIIDSQSAEITQMGSILAGIPPER